MISTTDYFKKFEGSAEITEQFRKNASKLLAKASTLLSLIPYETKITSGFRTKSYNKQINGSPNSTHCYAEGIDLWDPDKVIGEWCMHNENYLRQEGLFMESLLTTHKSEERSGRWCHLQLRPTKSGAVVFNP